MRTAILILAVAALSLCPQIGFTAQQLDGPADLQAQIDELKQRLAEMDELRARLAALEEQLAATRQAQEKTEAARAKETKEHRFNGYMQMRYRNDNATSGKDEFFVRRARFNIRGDVSPETAYRLELQLDSKLSGSGPGSKAQLRTAYVQQALGGGRIRIGQTHLPWGYELQTGVPVLWSSERALFMDRLFPNQRDIGLEYEWAQAGSPVINLGLFNGAGINTGDNNNQKDIVARVRVPLRQGSFALSYYDGNSAPGSAAKDGARWGAGTQAKLGNLEFMGEYVQGDDEGADIAGWYAQLGTKVGRTPGFIYVKYDTYDENTDISGDKFRRYTYGCFYDLDAKNRLALAYEDRDVEAGFSELSKWDDDAYYLQWQLKY